MLYLPVFHRSIIAHCTATSSTFQEYLNSSELKMS